MKQSLSIESESQQDRHSAVSVNSAVGIQAFADNRESTATLRQFKAAVVNSPQAATLSKTSQLMNNSPRVLAQRKMLSGESVQRVEEDEPLQKKSEPIQCVEEEGLQKKAATDSPSQLKEQSSAQTNNTANNTGLPDNLKSGIESLSGMSMDSVRVHYNSSQPAQLNALAYAQGTDIHVAPGQEHHLPHEAWHVVQQAQGRVKPTVQMAGQQVNDDVGLEHEADVMGGKAVSAGVMQARQGSGNLIESASMGSARHQLGHHPASISTSTQLKTHINHDTTIFDAEMQSSNFPVGIGMQAVLDPSDPVIGSAASGKVTSSLNTICNLFNPRLQQTHLLNADLGGFGVYQNLYPMTGKGNREHYNKVELHVKNAFFKASSNLAKSKESKTFPKTEGTGVYYEIKVHGNHSYTDLKTNSQQFFCAAYYVNDVINAPVANATKPIVVDTVTSNPASDNSTAPGWAGFGDVIPAWNHNQGGVGPNTMHYHVRHIKTREGEANAENVFSKYIKGAAWNDYQATNKISLNFDRNNGANNEFVYWTKQRVRGFFSDETILKHLNHLISILQNRLDKYRIPKWMKDQMQTTVDYLYGKTDFKPETIRDLGESAFFEHHYVTNGPFPENAFEDAFFWVERILEGIEESWFDKVEDWKNDNKKTISYVAVELKDLSDKTLGVYRAKSVVIHIDDGLETEIDADYLVDNDQAFGDPSSLVSHIAEALGIDKEKVIIKE